MFLEEIKPIPLPDIEELSNSFSPHWLATAMTEISWFLLYTWYQVTFYSTGPCNKYHNVFNSLLLFRTCEKFCFSVIILKVASYFVTTTLKSDELSKEINSSLH
jgi:hypothetical protein